MTRRPNHRRAPLSVHARRARSWFWTWFVTMVLSAASVAPLVWFWWSIDYANPSGWSLAGLYVYLSVAQYACPVLAVVGWVSFTATLYHAVMK